MSSLPPRRASERISGGRCSQPVSRRPRINMRRLRADEICTKLSLSSDNGSFAGMSYLQVTGSIMFELSAAIQRTMSNELQHVRRFRAATAVQCGNCHDLAEPVFSATNVASRRITSALQLRQRTKNDSLWEECRLASLLRSAPSALCEPGPVSTALLSLHGQTSSGGTASCIFHAADGTNVLWSATAQQAINLCNAWLVVPVSQSDHLRFLQFACWELYVNHKHDGSMFFRPASVGI